MKNTIFKNTSSQSGFTLVELLVGMIIGLIATLVVMQTFTAFEGSKRSTVGTSEAQTNGNIAIYMLQRELQSAGYGLPLAVGNLPVLSAANTYQRAFENYNGKTPAEIAALRAAAATAYATTISNEPQINSDNYSALHCTTASTTYSLDHDGDAATAKKNVKVANPVEIIDGGTGSDTITLVYGDTDRGGMGTKVTSATGGTATIGVASNFGCRQNDIVISISNRALTGCYVNEVVSTNTVLDANSVQVQLASNPATGGVQNGQVLACLGQIREITFDTASNKLRRNGQEIVDEVVSLQAQYGVSATPNSEIVNAWQNATGSWAPGSISINDRNRIKAIRIAVVARNNLLEKDNVTNAAPAWAGGSINLSADANWQRYRYRTYELVVPLRNVLAASPLLK